MKAIKSVRGMHDLIHNTQLFKHHQFIIEHAIQTAKKHNFKRIETPHVEFAQLFERTLGTTSDVIKKEMFLLQQNDDENDSSASQQWMCLRPEGTAGVVRSVIQHNLFNSSLYYLGSMYRYERPQKGRLRQFTQFGVEKIGEKKVIGGSVSLQQDIEVLQLAHSFLKSIGLRDHVTLELNSLGSVAERNAYANTLLSFLQEYQTSLSEESQHRLKLAVEEKELQHVWRILDSKSEEDVRVITENNAPLLAEFYTEDTRNRFDNITGILNELGIQYKLNPYLVRGLDYYSHTTFEFKAMMAGSPNSPKRNVAVLAGGRYNDLFQMLGSRDEVESIGWAAGVERLSILLEEKISQDNYTRPPGTTIGIIGLTNSSNIDRRIQLATLQLAEKLRESKQIDQDTIVATPVYTSKVLNGLQKLERNGCTIAIIIGSREVETGTCMIKSLTNRDVKEDACPIDQVIPRMNHLRTK
jgi:histidyl-tRNA synthetase